jgi:hypothetical protein
LRVVKGTLNNSKRWTHEPKKPGCTPLAYRREEQCTSPVLVIYPMVIEV